MVGLMGEAFYSMGKMVILERAGLHLEIYTVQEEHLRQIICKMDGSGMACCMALGNIIIISKIFTIGDNLTKADLKAKELFTMMT